MSIPPFPDEPYAEVTHDFLEAALLVVVRHEKVALGDLPSVFEAAFAVLQRAIDTGLVTPNGPAIAVYDGDPAGRFDLEVGYPVMSAPTRDIPTADEPIHASALPAGPAALLSHIGPWDELPGTWQRLADGADGAPRGIWIEVYVSDPAVTEPARLRTDLVLPLGAMA